MPPPEVSRNISLTPELAGFVEDCLASGDYGNTEEVIRAASLAGGRRRMRQIDPGAGLEHGAGRAD
jgi:Arc/MetJ-type ribon-helix-helix transcriptional regulator